MTSCQVKDMFSVGISKQALVEFESKKSLLGYFVLKMAH